LSPSRDVIYLLSESEVHGLAPNPLERSQAGPLLLSWAGVLGQREIMASRQHCRETALPKNSWSAKHSRA